MATLCDAAKEFHLDNFVITTKHDSYNYIICGQIENEKYEWITTDGNIVWKLITNEQQLEALIGSKSIQQYFSDFRTILDADKLKITRVTRTDDIKLFTDDGKISLILKPVGEKSKELSFLLFFFADQIKTLTKRIKDQPTKRASDQRGMYDQSLMNLDAHKKGQNKFRQKEGMSLINPSSKKLKVAKGINFE